MLIAVFLLAGPPAAAEEPAPCRASPTARALDFWLGNWRVVGPDGQHYGDNRIEAALDGCAVLEHWTNAAGGQGISLFAYNGLADSWLQLWVTGDTARPGGYKEKRLIARGADGSVRFQGVIEPGDGIRYLDRTTLTPLADGRVRQVIERSMDGGQTWDVGFDAFYLPAGDP